MVDLLLRYTMVVGVATDVADACVRLGLFAVLYLDRLSRIPYD